MALFGWSYMSTIIIGEIILFFVIAIVSRQLNNFGVDYNKWLGWGAGLIACLIVALIWAIGPAFFIGFIASLIAGFFGGQFLGGDEGE